MPDQYSARERASAEAMKSMVGQSLEWCLPIARVALRAADGVVSKPTPDQVAELVKAGIIDLSGGE